MEIAPYINASFTPSAAPAGTTPADHLANGLYAYINADKDPELKKQSDSTFGRTVPFDSSETQATLIGRSFASHTGYRQNPLQYLRDNKLPVPPNWSGENYQLYTIIGQHIISKSQEHYNNAKAARDKALADAQAANMEQQARNAKCISIEKEAPARDPNQPREEMMAYIGLALVGLFVAGWVLYVVAVVLLTMKDWLVQRVRGTFGTMRAGVPVIWRRMSSPEGMRAAFLVLVAALVLIALCLVVIAFVLLF